MKAALLLLLGLLCSCGESGPPEPAWGVTIVCKILSEDLSNLKDQLRIIERRLAGAGFPRPHITILPSKRIEFRVPGADSSNFNAAARAILSRGLFAFCEVGDAATQSSWAAHRVVPDGFRAYQSVDPARRPGRPWDVDVILLRQPPLWGTGAIQDAWAEREPSGAWRVAFKLTSGHQVPATPVAIVLDGRINVLAHLMIDERGTRIVGALTEEDARNLAYILLQSALTVRLGGGPGGHSEADGPESWEFYGTPPAKAP